MWKQATNPLYVAGKRKQYTFIIPDPYPTLVDKNVLNPPSKLLYINNHTKRGDTI
jgi:hypothetical protein